MEKLLETGWVSLQVGWGTVLGNHQDRVNSKSQVNEDSDMVPTCWICGRAQRRNNNLCQHFCLGEIHLSSSYPDAKEFSSSLYIPGAF